MAVISCVAWLIVRCPSYNLSPRHAWSSQLFYFWLLSSTCCCACEQNSWIFGTAGWISWSVWEYWLVRWCAWLFLSRISLLWDYLLRCLGVKLFLCRPWKCWRVHSFESNLIFILLFLLWRQSIQNVEPTECAIWYVDHHVMHSNDSHVYPGSPAPASAMWSFSWFLVDSESPQGSAPRCWLSLAWPQTWRLVAFPRWCRCETSETCQTHQLDAGHEAEIWYMIIWYIVYDAYIAICKIMQFTYFTAAESGGIFLASVHGASDFCSRLSKSVDVAFGFQCCRSAFNSRSAAASFFVPSQGIDSIDLTTFTCHFVAKVLHLFWLYCCLRLATVWSLADRVAFLGLLKKENPSRDMATKWRYLERCNPWVGLCCCVWQEVRIHVCNFNTSEITGGLSTYGLARVCNLHNGLLRAKAQMSLDMKRNVLEKSGQFWSNHVVA